MYRSLIRIQGQGRPRSALSIHHTAPSTSSSSSSLHHPFSPHHVASVTFSSQSPCIRHYAIFRPTSCQKTHPITLTLTLTPTPTRAHFTTHTTDNSHDTTTPTSTSTSTPASTPTPTTASASTSPSPPPSSRPHVTDLSHDRLLFRITPHSWHPYWHLARLDRPIGTWLLLWPCLWSVALATPSGHLPNLSLLSIFTVGAITMRGAGCTINDLWDRDYDGKVVRTSTRPLPSGAVTPIGALTFLAAQLSIGLLVVTQLNLPTLILAFGSIPIVIIYPLMKRFTNWPQAVLGLCFNWGALVGYTAVTGHADWNVMLPLYASGVTWTLVYDTIYAHQDTADDSALGLRSTALHFGDHSRLIMSGLAALSTSSLALCGYMADMHLPFYLISVGGAAIHYMWQLTTVDLTQRASCHAKFISNKWWGLLVFMGIVCDRWWSKATIEQPLTLTEEEMLNRESVIKRLITYFRTSSTPTLTSSTATSSRTTT